MKPGRETLNGGIKNVRKSQNKETQGKSVCKEEQEGIWNIKH